MFNIPSHVEQVVKTLSKSGYRAYVVGGAVRDLLLGKEPHDWDVTTNALPDQVQKAFKKTYPTGRKHGTISVQVDGNIVEVTTFRKDGIYHDGRRPSSVEFTDNLTEDLSRRDFTMNAIAYDAINKELIDPFGGTKDINSKILKAVGNAKDRFIEDPLRMLRAIRFVSSYSMTLDQDIGFALMNYNYMLVRISQERIRDELVKILTSPFNVWGLEDLRLYRLLEQVLPMHELLAKTRQSYPHVWTVWSHIIRTVGNLEGENIELLLAGLFHDIGKYETMTIEEDDSIHFYGHEIVGAKITEAELQRLKFPNKTIKRVVTLVRYHMFDENMGKKAIKRLLRKVDKDFTLLYDLIRLREADLMAMDKKFASKKLQELELFKKRVQEIEKENEALDVTDLAIDGYDAMDLGFVGKEVGQALEYAMQGVLNGLVKNNREALLDYIKKG